MKKIVSTSGAPAAIGPYSQAVRAGEFLFISGQIPLEPYRDEITKTTIEEQAHQVFKNIGAILEAQKLSFKNVVKTTVFLTDMNDFAKVNEVYKKYFLSDCPARSAVAVATLPKGAMIECEAIAYSANPSLEWIKYNNHNYDIN